MIKKIVWPALFVFTVIFFMNSCLASVPVEKDKQILTKLLADFLQGASKNDPGVHERFWSDDLIYTSSAGKRFGKAEIMQSLQTEEKEGASSESTPQYFARDIDIRILNDTAIVAFRLVAENKGASKDTLQTYFNTGTFVKREGRWQALAWQATKIPVAEK